MQVSTGKGAALETLADVTAWYAPTLAEGAYPWVTPDGPFIPAVLYHARRGLPRLFDPFYGVELVRGSLFASVGWTMWKHAYRDGAHPQRNAIDVEPAGGVRPSSRTPNAATVTTDLSSILMWRSKGDKTGSLFQFEPGMDPIALGNALENYCAGLVASYGISPADVQRVAADPRSGYAIALSREGIRKEIARYQGTFAAGDRELIGVVAALANIYMGGTYPITGWQVKYRGLPKSPDEIKIEAEQAAQDVALGIASVVDTYVARHGVTRKEAVKALERIAAENALVGAFGRVASEEMGAPTPPATEPADPGNNPDDAPKGAPGDA
jgi:hypothetical protein